MDETLLSLVKEVLEDSVLETCADNGTRCFFCGAEWNQTMAMWGVGPAIKHHSDCWTVRAQKAVADEEASRG